MTALERPGRGSVQEDRQLVRKLQRGDAAALRQIYLTYKDELLTVAVCIVLDLAASEDVLHDVFVGLARNAAGREIRRNLRGYLTTSVANRARDHLRAQARRHRLQRAASASAAAAAATNREPPTALLGGAEAQAVCAALGEVPDEQREVIALHLHGGLTFRQIARYQRVATDTAKSRYRYGLNKLKSLLQPGADP